MYQYALLSKSFRILERPAIPMSNLLSRGVLQDGEEKLAYVDHSLALCFAVSTTLIPSRAQSMWPLSTLLLACDVWPYRKLFGRIFNFFGAHL